MNSSRTLSPQTGGRQAPEIRLRPTTNVSTLSLPTRFLRHELRRREWRDYNIQPRPKLLPSSCVSTSIPTGCSTIRPYAALRSQCSEVPIVFWPLCLVKARPQPVPKRNWASATPWPAATATFAGLPRITISGWRNSRPASAGDSEFLSPEMLIATRRRTGPTSSAPGSADRRSRSASAPCFRSC